MAEVPSTFDNVLLDQLVLQNTCNQRVNTMTQLSVSEYSTTFGIFYLL